MEDETRDRVITGALAVIAGIGGAVEAPPFAPVVLTIMGLALIAALFAPEDLLKIVKWVLVAVVVVFIIVLLLVIGTGYVLLHLIGLA